VNGDRETLHDFSLLEYVKVLAEVFGWRVATAPGPARGPDVVIEHTTGRDGRNTVDAVMFVESEVGHDIGGAKGYFEKLCKRIRPLIDSYRERYRVARFSIVVITNAPRRLTRHLREHRRELEERLGIELVEGRTVFIVPALMAREALPAVFVRAMGTDAGYA